MKIPGWVYLLVGGFLIGFSYYTTSVNKNLELSKLMLFVWIGYVFLGIGAIKIILGMLGRAKAKPKKHKHHQSHAHHQHHAHQHASHQNQQQPSQAHVKYCTNCGAPMRNFDKFCYRCGNRHFHR